MAKLGMTTNERPVGDLQFFDNRIGYADKDRIQLTFTIRDHVGNHVSRNHCEFYVIVYEDDINHVYVRDLVSLNGTYVNGQLIGMAPMISPGYLLSDGDVIEIKPHWKFKFSHHINSPMESPLSDVQLKEAKGFKHMYKLTERCLGKGAEASVYLATDTKTKKQLVCKVVDLKELEAGGKTGRARAARLIQETDILRQLHHPNILPYVDALRSPNTSYTFTELASGGDLMSFLYRHPKIIDFHARLIIRQVVHGLKYLHSKGVVHRDLKPENILLAYSPRILYHRVIIADFGASSVPQRSRMTTMVGTEDYQAPEFLTKSRSHNASADIWSLGVIAFILVAGADADVDSLRKHRQSALDCIVSHAYSKRLPPPSDKAKCFIDRCLRVLSDERMTAKQADIHEWLCTPKNHLQFFHDIDKRMMKDWKEESLLRPMHRDLSSMMDVVAMPALNKEDINHEVAKNTDANSKVKEQTGISPHFAKLDTFQRAKDPTKISSRVNIANVGVYGRFTKHTALVKPEREAPDELSEEMPPQPYSPKKGSGITDSSTAPAASNTLTQVPPQSEWRVARISSAHISEQIFPWMARRPKLSYKPSRHSSSTAKRRRRQMTGGILVAPTATLDRHLPRHAGGPPREWVLAEVRKTRRPFLKNSEISASQRRRPRSRS